jgi:GT2 family glycosyltransferase
LGLVLSSSPSATETLSVVLVNWNAKDDLRRCLQSLEHQTRPPEQIIVIDNASGDGSQRMVHEDFPDVILDTFSENRGFAAACNRGIELATGSWVAMLNNDAVAHAEWCAALVEAAA